MPRTYTICGHKRRPAIEKAVLAGEALRAIAGRWSVSRSSPSSVADTTKHTDFQWGPRAPKWTRSGHESEITVG